MVVTSMGNTFANALIIFVMPCSYLHEFKVNVDDISSAFRHKRLEMLRQVQVHEDSCNLCFDGAANITLQPCGHR